MNTHVKQDYRKEHKGRAKKSIEKVSEQPQKLKSQKWMM